MIQTDLIHTHHVASAWQLPCSRNHRIQAAAVFLEEATGAGQMLELGLMAFEGY